MDHDNEKVRDIVAEMREHGDRITNGGVMADGADLRDYAARIEAAARRKENVPCKEVGACKS